jgi:hypothetical protein
VSGLSDYSHCIGTALAVHCRSCQAGRQCKIVDGTGRQKESPGPCGEAHAHSSVLNQLQCDISSACRLTWGHGKECVQTCRGHQNCDLNVLQMASKCASHNHQVHQRHGETLDG